MDQSYINTVTDLAKALNLPVHTDINRLMKRCRFNRRGYLSRLYLNGLNLKGTIDISEYTKHLTALDSRNNPELRDIRISALSELGFLLSFDSEELYSDALKTDKGQTVYVIEPGHDSDESPFAKYFNSDESAPSAPSEPDSKNTASDTTRTVISDTSYDSVQADDHALAAGTEIEKALLRNAIIGRELTTCLQDNFDRTNIGMFNKGLIQVQKLATQLERIKSIKQL
ncbi:MAG: hypothetical protein J6Y89_05890, partial [Lachnospiraceae bacterium]|nr:hypothetical protein [Lachnospiraceae bacterium]